MKAVVVIVAEKTNQWGRFPLYSQDVIISNYLFIFNYIVRLLNRL
jgi:hypothetical protein